MRDLNLNEIIGKYKKDLGFIDGQKEYQAVWDIPEDDTYYLYFVKVMDVIIRQRDRPARFRSQGS